MGVESNRDGEDDTTYRIVAESARTRKRRASESGEHSLEDEPSQDEAAPDEDAARDPGEAAAVFALDDDPAADDDSAEEDASAEDEDERPSDGGEGDAVAGEGDGARRVPSLEDLDRLIGRGDYATICKQLGPVERAGELSPALALLYATAHKEVTPDAQSAEVNYLAIRSLAALLGVAEDSRIALNLAKRIVRQNPVSGPRPAPPPVARVALIVLGLAVGIVAGWLAGPGGVNLVEILEAVMR